MRTPEQIKEILKKLAEEYPLADCTLDYEQAWELLVGVRLAAQCTDERVNLVLPALFEKYPSAQVMAQAQPEDVEPYIRSCGFYRGKARDIVGAAKMLVEEFGGCVPDNMRIFSASPVWGERAQISSWGMYITFPAAWWWIPTASGCPTGWDWWTA